MPPILSRKRIQSDSPEPEPPPKRTRANKPPARRSKESVFQTLETVPKVKRTLSQTKAFLEQGDDESELSEPESSEDDFEDVPLNRKDTAKAQGDEDSEASADDKWEDALEGQTHGEHDHGPAPIITGDIALTLSAAPKTAFDTKPDGRKGPSKVLRQIRNATHCMHVQFLMFHNLIRNAWIQDIEVQKTLVKGLSSSCWIEVDRYWRDAGIAYGINRAVAKRREPANTPSKGTKGKKGRWAESGKKGVQVYESPQSKRMPAPEDKKKAFKGKGNEQLRGDRNKGDRSARDWGAASEPLEPGTPNLSAGDPLMRLLRYLSAYWKSKFRITAPGLRKRGYLSPVTLEAEVNTWKEAPMHPDVFGERIESLEEFRKVAHLCEGSRDVGEQLFTALLRGLGIEARMIVSLQPVGFGFSQVEEGRPKNLEKLQDTIKQSTTTSAKGTSSKGKIPQRATTRDKKTSLDGDASDSGLSSVISISSDTDEDKPIKKSPKQRNYSDELPYPTYWTEAISHLTHTPISVSPLPRVIIAGASSPDKLQDFYARGVAAEKARQVLAYLIAFSSDGSAKDVTTRYLPKHQWPGRTKGFRMPIEKIPIHNRRGKVKRWEEWDWLGSLMRPYARAHNKRQPWDEVEDEGDLVPAEPEKKKDMDEEGGKETLQGYKNSTEYVLERHLRRDEALKPGAKIVRQFVSGKGDNEKSEPVYRRKDVANCKTVESWHKEGREVKEGEQPLKFVPVRAVTVIRKREMEERERDEGVKPKQGLYSRAQTDWIVPPPIVNGKIPRNAFNNIDIYVPTMVPEGAVHIPLRGTARICRKLNIEHAEACTGFEFGKQRAVPILTGVVVATENEDMVIDAWEVDEAEKTKKEADKREKLVLGLWRKFMGGLRIVERMKAEYGEDVELPAKPVKQTPNPPEPGGKNSEWEVFQNHSDFEGGFLRGDEPADGGFVHEEPPQVHHDEDMAGGFFAASQEDPVHGDLVIDHGEKKVEERTAIADTSYRTPISLTSALQKPIDEGVDAPQGEDFMDIDELQENSEDDEPRKLSSSRRQSKSTRPSRGRPRGRAARVTPASTSTRRRKSVLVDSSDEEAKNDSSLSDPPTPPLVTRSAPKRKAARKSDAKVKSHFFAEGSEGETDLTDMTDRTSPKKGAVTRGKGSVTGRGRGRGRGKTKG